MIPRKSRHSQECKNPSQQFVCALWPYFWPFNKNKLCRKPDRQTDKRLPLAWLL